jgi:hypothetical protein
VLKLKFKCEKCGASGEVPVRYRRADEDMNIWLLSIGPDILRRHTLLSPLCDEIWMSLEFPGCTSRSKIGMSPEDVGNRKG